MHGARSAPQPPRLPDPDDEPLLRLAEASGLRLITTHNLRLAAAHGVAVMPPRDLVPRERLFIVNVHPH